MLSQSTYYGKASLAENAITAQIYLDDSHPDNQAFGFEVRAGLLGQFFFQSHFASCTFVFQKGPYVYDAMLAVYKRFMSATRPHGRYYPHDNDFDESYRQGVLLRKVILAYCENEAWWRGDHHLVLSFVKPRNTVNMKQVSHVDVKASFVPRLAKENNESLLDMVKLDQTTKEVIKRSLNARTEYRLGSTQEYSIHPASPPALYGTGYHLDVHGLLNHSAMEMYEAVYQSGLNLQPISIHFHKGILEDQEDRRKMPFVSLLLSMAWAQGLRDCPVLSIEAGVFNELEKFPRAPLNFLRIFYKVGQDGSPATAAVVSSVDHHPPTHRNFDLY